MIINISKYGYTVGFEYSELEKYIKIGSLYLKLTIKE